MRINPTIRLAQPGDIDEIILLCKAHAAYEKTEYRLTNQKESLLNDLFLETPKLYCIVVVYDHVIIGYATYMKQYSTWNAEEYIYMDCIFLKEYARGLGLGGKIIYRIQEEGKKMGCTLIQWQTPNFNTRAIKFYKRIGAVPKLKERFFMNVDL